jgi:hypothetical protein
MDDEINNYKPEGRREKEEESIIVIFLFTSATYV